MPVEAIVLFGHGSRDPQWREPMDAVAARILARKPIASVRCAFLELQSPDLATACAELAASGVASITVVPMFLGVGRHAREDLPRQLAQVRDRHPGVLFKLMPAVGEDPRMLDLLASIALDAP